MAGESDFTVIRVFQSRLGAEISMSLLQSAGFDAYVWADDAAGMLRGTLSPSGVRLVVPQDQAEGARRVLSERDARGGLAEERER